MSKDKSNPKSKPTPPKPTPIPVSPPRTREKMGAEAPPRKPSVKPPKK